MLADLLPNRNTKTMSPTNVGPKTLSAWSGSDIVDKAHNDYPKNVRLGVLRFGCAVCFRLLVILLLLGCTCASFQVGLERNISRDNLEPF